MNIPFRQIALTHEVEATEDLLSLPDWLQAYFVEKQFPIRLATQLSLFAAHGYEPFRPLLSLPWNQNKLSEVCSLLLELAKKERRSPWDFLPPCCGSKISSEHIEHIRSSLRQKRNPLYEAKHQAFQQKVKKLKLGAIQLTPSPYFESDWVELKMRLGEVKDLERLKEVLEKKTEWEELFKIL